MNKGHDKGHKWQMSDRDEPWDASDMAYRPGGLSIGQDKNVCGSSSQTSVTQNISNKLKDKNT